MNLLTDEASEQLSRGVSAIGGGLLGITVVLLLAAAVYGWIGVVLLDTSVGAAVGGWLWADETPAYFVFSALAVLLLYVESDLEEEGDEPETSLNGSDERDRTNSLWHNLSATFRLMAAVNAVVVVVLSGVVAGVLVSKTPVSGLAGAAALSYPYFELRVNQKIGALPTPVMIGILVSIPLAVVPTLYTVPFHVLSVLSKGFANVVARATVSLLSLTTRVTDAVPQFRRFSTRSSPRRR